MSAPSIYLPEQMKIVDATAGAVTTNGGVTGAYVSLKNAIYAWLVLQFTQAVSHATVITMKEATAVAGTAVQTVANAVQIWSNLATATNDTLVKRTSATGYTLGTGAYKGLVVIGIDPAAVSQGFDVVGFTLSDSSQATNFVAGAWYLQTKYAQATPPTAVTD